MDCSPESYHREIAPDLRLGATLVEAGSALHGAAVLWRGRFGRGTKAKEILNRLASSLREEGRGRIDRAISRSCPPGSEHSPLPPSHYIHTFRERSRYQPHNGDIGSCAEAAPVLASLALTTVEQRLADWCRQRNQEREAIALCQRFDDEFEAADLALDLGAAAPPKFYENRDCRRLAETGAASAAASACALMESLWNFRRPREDAGRSAEWQKGHQCLLALRKERREAFRQSLSLDIPRGKNGEPKLYERSLEAVEDSAIPFHEFSAEHRADLETLRPAEHAILTAISIFLMEAGTDRQHDAVAWTRNMLDRLAPR